MTVPCYILGNRWDGYELVRAPEGDDDADGRLLPEQIADYQAVERRHAEWQRRLDELKTEWRVTS